MQHTRRLSELHRVGGPCRVPGSYVGMTGQVCTLPTAWQIVTSEQKLVIQEFTLHQIKLSKTIQQINERLGRNSNAFPVEKLLEYFRTYHETFVQLVEDLKASK